MNMKMVFVAVVGVALAFMLLVFGAFTDAEQVGVLIGMLIGLVGIFYVAKFILNKVLHK